MLSFDHVTFKFIVSCRIPSGYVIGQGNTMNSCLFSTGRRLFIELWPVFLFSRKEMQEFCRKLLNKKYFVVIRLVQ